MDWPVKRLLEPVKMKESPDCSLKLMIGSKILEKRLDLDLLVNASSLVDKLQG